MADLLIKKNIILKEEINLNYNFIFCYLCGVCFGGILIIKKDPRSGRLQPVLGSRGQRNFSVLYEHIAM